MALGALPDDAVKGGNSLKIRYGNQTICFTRDLYTARIRNFDDSFKNSKTPSSQDGGALPEEPFPKYPLPPKVCQPLTS